MDLVIMIYLADTFSDLSFTGFYMAFVLLMVFTILFYLIEDGNVNAIPILKFLSKTIKCCTPVIAIMLVLQGLSPSKQTAYTMLAVYGVSELLITEKAEVLGSKSFKLLESYVDKYTKELNQEINSNNVKQTIAPIN